ncbi:hypothetical protein CFIO01_09512 [Colletotrichum fioriniae PJ7]|uniref:Zn(2)-C6 fungal-type domain-containing protein n=1 Tax=Colletotrichum fioriniae PJ7 TaxID=1445577 RepID=A0A010QR09_9PEZI|nr:hypothetical protein CFIO01_09512 [Colletotrichum fioriniae PJ7]
MACKACRAKKIKCDRVRPVCQNCRQRASHCSYAGERRVRRWTEADADNRRRSISQNDQSPSIIDLGQRSLPRQPGANAAACHVQQGPCLQSTTGSTHRMPEGTERNDAESDFLDWGTAIAAPAAPSNWQTMDSNSMASLFAQMARGSEVILQTPAGSTSTQGECLLDKILDGDEDFECLKDASPAVWGRTTDGDEYTGPSSGISTVSDLGLNWIREKVPDSDLLCETIQDIRNAILSHIRQPKCVTQDLPLVLSTAHQNLDISRRQLLEYIDAYFSQVQVVFPILDRDTFNVQLDEMGDGSGDVQKPSWAALLNVVVASGLRASLSDETSEAFRTSGSEAWRYFQSALSYESQIVHGATDLLAVQAVALMAVFAQGLSSPQRLEYTLSSVASRLAQSIGLNCAPPPEWNLSDAEKKERNRVFWAVYCLDKSIALRCALTTIFVHVVSNPYDSCNQSDIALMETVVGFFGRLEYVTSGEAAFTKTTEFVRQARKVIDSYKKKGDSRSIQSTTSYEDLMKSMEMSLQGGASTQGRPAEVTGVYARNSITTSQDFDASDITGTSLLPQAESSRMEAVSEENHPVSGVPSVREMEISQNSHTLYSDLAGLTVPNMEDSIQVQW